MRVQVREWYTRTRVRKRKALYVRTSHRLRFCSPPLSPLCLTFQTQEKPDVTYSDIGGLDIQKQELKEAVELPLTHFDLYKQIGTWVRS